MVDDSKQERASSARSQVSRGWGNPGRLLRSGRFVWAVHVALFALFTLILLTFVYQVVFDRIGIITWVAVTAFLVEVIILLANGGRCPITVYNETLGIESARVSDAFLPRWIADRVFPIYGATFAIGLIVLLFRLTR
jgi:hypothetical protein